MNPLPARLQGPRVHLRAMRATDIGDTHLGWLRDPEVVRFSNQRFVAHTLESCRRYLDSFEGSPNLYASIRRSEDDLALGTLTAYRHPHHGTADIGILVGARCVWGQGFGSEAFTLLADWLAVQPGMRKLTCGTLAVNHGMRRIAERAGFHEEGRRRAQEMVEGRAEDIVYFARFAHGA